MTCCRTTLVAAAVVVVAVVAAALLSEVTVVDHDPWSIRSAKPVVSAADAAAGVDYFRSPHGYWLYTRRYPHTSSGPARGVVLILHGWAEHLSRQGWANLFFHLNAAGYDVYAHEQVGHGWSDGDRAYNPVFQRYVDDAHAFHTSLLARADVQQALGGGKPFLLGHSMGTLVALQSVRQFPALYGGLITSGACCYVDPATASPALLTASRLLARYVPKLPLPALEIKSMSSNATAVASYVTDPLVWRGGMRALWSQEFLATAMDIEAHVSEVRLPVLALHGAADGICNPQCSHALTTSPQRNAATKLAMFAGAGHELYEDADHCGGVFDDITGWLKAL